MKPLTYGSLFSGTECMSAAAIGLPLVPRFFAEVEPYPCAILRSKFPDVPNLGDVTKIKYDSERKELSNDYGTAVDLRDGLDVLAGGSPCQDFSTAGLRAGARSETLDDGGTTRSSLIYTYVRLVREIRPRWIVYENVPGMLTSNEGRDFAHFLVALAQCGYGDFAWRVLDAQYVRVDGMERAVPQRRRRVWLVGRLGANDGRAAEVLLEPYGDPGDIPPRRKTGEEVARSLAARAGVHGGVVGGAGQGGVSAFNFELWANPPSGLIDAVCARRAHDWMLAHAPASFDPFEPGGLKSVRTDGASQTVVNGTCPGSHNAVVTNSNGGDVAPTLAVADLVKQYTGQADRGGGYVCATIENHASDARATETAVAPTMGASRNANASNDNPLVVAQPRSYGMNPQNGSQMFPCTEEVGQTLAVQHQGGVVQRVETGSNGNAVAPTLTTELAHQQGDSALKGGGYVRSTCLTPGDPLTKRVYTADGAAPTLMAIAKDSGISAQSFVLPAAAEARSSLAPPRRVAAGDPLPEVVVRRLTPTECERLMGLPDNWTRVTFTPEQIADPETVAYFRRVHDDWQKMNADDGKTPKPKTEAFVRDWLARISDPATCPDAPRYKACGNGWATNCPRWILLNLLRAEGVDPWYQEETK